jgi:hypothetical protein
MIDDVISLKRDTFVYKRLIQRYEEISHRNTSSYVTKKVQANFAEDTTRLPLLKYQSKAVWDTGIFGAVASIEMESTFKKNVQIDKLPSIYSLDSSSNYEIEELVDPVLFEEWLIIYSKLKPYQIAWLATHRDRRHTYRCVLYDWNVWLYHIYRIFDKLRVAPPIYDCRDLRVFINREIDQAAKDAKQALEKIRNRDIARNSVTQILDALTTSYPLASQILQTIEPAFKINGHVFLMAKIRTCFTTILRSYLTKFALASENRAEKLPVECYFNRLENYCEALGNDWKTAVQALKKAFHEGRLEVGLIGLQIFFRRISTIEGFEQWFDNKQLELDQWLERRDGL